MKHIISIAIDLFLPIGTWFGIIQAQADGLANLVSFIVWLELIVGLLVAIGLSKMPVAERVKAHRKPLGWLTRPISTASSLSAAVMLIWAGWTWHGVAVVFCVLVSLHAREIYSKAADAEGTTKPEGSV